MAPDEAGRDRRTREGHGLLGSGVGARERGLLDPGRHWRTPRWPASTRSPAGHDPDGSNKLAEIWDWFVHIGDLDGATTTVGLVTVVLVERTLHRTSIADHLGAGRIFTAGRNVTRTLDDAWEYAHRLIEKDRT